MHEAARSAVLAGRGGGRSPAPAAIGDAPVSAPMSTLVCCDGDAASASSAPSSTSCSALMPTGSEGGVALSMAALSGEMYPSDSTAHARMRIVAQITTRNDTRAFREDTRAMHDRGRYWYS